MTLIRSLASGVVPTPISSVSSCTGHHRAWCASVIACSCVCGCACPACSGGKREDRDNGAEGTAAREAEEETHWAFSSSQLLPLLTLGHSLYFTYAKYLLFLAHIPDGQAQDLPKICAENIAGGLGSEHKPSAWED